MIKRNHKPIVNAFSKMSDKMSTNWERYLAAVLWTDWLTIRTFTDPAPYYICNSNEIILHIELEVSTQQILPWQNSFNCQLISYLYTLITMPRQRS